MVYVLAGGVWLLFLATPLFGVAIGVATTAAYTAAAAVMPATARGAGFGLLTTASLAGLALSPIVSGLLAATSIRAVFLLDVVGAGRARDRRVAADDRGAAAGDDRAGDGRDLKEQEEAGGSDRSAAAARG